jgi:hypothetical protein
MEEEIKQKIDEGIFEFIYQKFQNSFQGFKQPKPVVLLMQIIKSLKYFSKYLNEMSIEDYV